MTMPASAMPSRRLREVLEPFVEYAARSGESTLTVSRADLEGAALLSWPVENGKSEQRSNGDLVELQPMLQATRAFRARYDGEWVDIDVDTRVCVGHEIAQKHPEAFVPLDGVGINARIASANRSATSMSAVTDATPLYLPKRSPRAADQEHVELRSTRSPVNVVIPDRVRDVIADECSRRPDAETGGLLAGEISWSWHSSLRVAFAHPPGPKASHHRNRLTMDMDSYAMLSRELAQHESGLVLCGDWHSHPASAQPLPSPADLAGWLRGLDSVHTEHGSSRYLGVIVTPNKRGQWTSPVLNLYVVSRTARGRPVCEPAGSAS